MKLLLVDDNPIDLMLNERVISKLVPEAEIIKKESAISALEYLKEDGNIPEIIFLDIKMPLMNGFDLLNAIEKEDNLSESAVRVLMVTSSVDPQDKEKASEYEKVIGFIEKPISPEIITGYLEKV